MIFSIFCDWTQVLVIMSRSCKRQRTELDISNVPVQRTEAYRNPLLAAATKEDREMWNGFCEIESEPVCLLRVCLLLQLLMFSGIFQHYA